MLFPPLTGVKPGEFYSTDSPPTESGRSTRTLPSERTLRELVQFVVYTPPPQQHGHKGKVKQEAGPYSCIELLVDATNLPPNAIPQLLSDAERIFSLSLHELRFKIFVQDMFKETVLGKMPSVRQGYVPLYSLPSWSQDELLDLLQKRLIACLPSGEPIDPLNPASGPRWGTYIPTLAVNAKAKFEQVVVEYTRQACEHNPLLDAPSYALRLARGLLAACAKRWPELGPTIDLRLLQQLAASFEKTYDY